MLEYVPDDYGSYLILGQSLPRTGDHDGGIAALKKAESLRPDDPTAHAWLADIYDQMGRKSDAEHERSEAERLRSE